MNSAAQNRSWILGMGEQTATTALALAIMLLLAVFATGSAQAQTQSTLTDFDGSADGASPLYGNLIQGTDGNNYGTTVGGGVYDQGTVFKVTPDGTLTTLYSFCSQINCTDGAEPYSGLVQAGGNFYGTTLRGGVSGAGTVFEVTPGGQLTTLYSFCSQTNCSDGFYPFAGLVQFEGNLFGTTESGGVGGVGTVFELTPSGRLTTLHSFCSQTNCSDGSYPYAGLLQVGGNFYGTTQGGGGTIFKITPAGQLTTLHSFCSQTAGCADGQIPYAGLIQASDGNLYGTTWTGGNSGGGTIFKSTLAGQLTTLYSFCSQTNCADGELPYAGLIQASDGNLYGTTTYGGANGYGTAFGITLGGQLSTLHSFALTDGADPEGGLLEDTNGYLYGTTSFGGSRFDGTVFSLPVGLDPQPRFGKAAANTMIRRPDLTGATGARLGGNVGVIRGRPGTELRIREFAGASTHPMKVTATADKAKSSAESVTTLLSFDGANGAFPYSTFLIQSTDGNLYGTASGGGVYDQGTVFKVTAGGTLTTLYTFCSQINCTDGAEPDAGLVQATNGNFYGTTLDGGANGSGTIFEITPAGQLTTLYSFCSLTNCADGSYPQAALVQATNGNLYGTTEGGGSTDICYGCGTVFEITPAGQLTTLYTFCSQTNCADGEEPEAGLVQATNGNLYGTTSFAGGTYGGTVFEITPAGQLTTLYSFCSLTNCPDGAYPEARLVQATNGNLYGTTSFGGTTAACIGCGEGTVFAITLAGELSTLYTFCAQPNCSDGSYPYTGLIQATDGNLYGTTEGGGTYGVCFEGCGTVFEITPAGQLTTLHAFGITDGAYPLGGLLQANGNLYGTTEGGGSRFGGTIFSLPLAGALALSGPIGTAQVGTAYTSPLTATGGVPPYTFSIPVGTLPPGLSLDSSTGAITGTPNTVGTYNFTAQVADSKDNTAIASYNIGVISAGSNPTTTSLTLGPSAIPVGSVGPISMTATVTPVAGSGTPTGSITYFNGSTQVGTATLTAGVGTFNFNPSNLAVGIYSITAVYGGDGVFSASTSLPQTLGITQNGPFAYVVNGASNTVSMIDIPASLLVTTIPVGSAPEGVAVSPNGNQVYVTNAGGNSVSAISTATSSVVATIPVQVGPCAVAFTPDGTSAYVVNFNSNSVSVIDTASQTVVANVPVQSFPAGVAMALTSNGTFAYVTNLDSNTVSVIAVGSSPAVVQTISVGTNPLQVAVSPNSSLAYVTNGGSNTVSVISVANNTVTATIPLGGGPGGVAFTPDGGFAYVANSDSDTVSVIDTASSTVVNTVPGFRGPDDVAITADGSSAYVTNNANFTGNSVSVIATASNTITGTVTVGSSPEGVAIASAPPTELTITHVLNPTQPTEFNFGPHNYTVQYPPGTSFSNVNMTVTAAQTTQAAYQQRVAGTPFASSACIVYAGTGGNCVDYQVTCSNANNNSPISCPSEPSPNISVETSYNTQQTIINPGFLTAPIGTNQWQNIFSGLSLLPMPTTRGITKGFSEFYAVDLGAGNAQGAGTFAFSAPLLPTNPRVFEGGVEIPVTFQLVSVAHPGQSVTDAVAGLSVVWVSDASGNPESKVVLASKDAFHYESGIGGYLHEIDTTGYQAGTYILTVYGNAFAAQQVQFTIQLPVASCIVPSLSSIDFGNVDLNRRKKKELILTNHCTTEVQISAISFIDVSGDPSDFSVRAYCHNQEMRPGHTCVLAVHFSPDALTTDTATLNIVNNPPGGTVQVPITGTGVPEP